MSNLQVEETGAMGSVLTQLNSLADAHLQRRWSPQRHGRQHLGACPQSPGDCGTQAGAPTSVPGAVPGAVPERGFSAAV